jgi:phosphate transport system permease protein
MSVATPLDLDARMQVISGVGTVLLLAGIASFLVVPSLTGYLALAFAGYVLVSGVADQERTAKFLLFVTTTSTVVILGFITLYLVVNAVPVVREMGAYLLVGSDPFWSTGSDVYSLVPMIWGTFLTTVIAMLVAAPLGIAGAVFISELAPDWAREIIKPGVEILAGIPSIVYGFIGFQILNPYMMNELGLPTFGSLFVVGFVIGVMALPTVVSVAEDAIASVPGPMKDGAHALGATDWQTTTSVTLPASFSGVSAAVLLGVGRAVGETMAATVILANVVALPEPLTDVFGSTITLTSLIASQYGSASGLQFSALFAAGVVLFVTVMALSVGSQLIERRMKRKLGGER